MLMSGASFSKTSDTATHSARYLAKELFPRKLRSTSHGHNPGVAEVSAHSNTPTPPGHISHDICHQLAMIAFALFLSVIA